MADDPELERLQSEDDEGGPVKTFLDHLEDLRWVLIKSFVTLGVTFVVCLIAGNWVVDVLTYPLKKAKVGYPRDVQAVSVMFGTNRLGVFKLGKADQESLQLGTNPYVTLRLQPITVGTNTVLGFKADADQTEARRLFVPLVSQSPAGAFIVAVQVAIYAGGILAAPFILFFVAQFVFPALRMKEKKYVFSGLFYSLGLFLAGITFCYFALMPVALSASVSYTEWLGFSVQQWRAEDYISFVSKFMLGMGLGFEMPVILLVLVKIGVLNHTMLAKARRYVIVINFFLGAVLTTPEIITQVLMALPLQGLYEITIWIAWYWEQENRSMARRKAALALSLLAALLALFWAAWKYVWPHLH